MTGTELLELALPLMFSSDAAEYGDSALPVINLMLADCFELNNSMLTAAGEAELTEIPEIGTLEDALPYADEINRKVLPFGLAGYLYAEDDAAIATQRLNKYEYEKSARYRADNTEIVDYYGGDDE